jgi:hypothetical protein
LIVTVSPNGVPGHAVVYANSSKADKWSQLLLNNLLENDN